MNIRRSMKLSRVSYCLYPLGRTKRWIVHFKYQMYSVYFQKFSILSFMCISRADWMFMQNLYIFMIIKFMNIRRIDPR